MAKDDLGIIRAKPLASGNRIKACGDKSHISLLGIERYIRERVTSRKIRRGALGRCGRTWQTRVFVMKRGSVQLERRDY